MTIVYKRHDPMGQPAYVRSMTYGIWSLAVSLSSVVLNKANSRSYLYTYTIYDSGLKSLCRYTDLGNKSKNKSLVPFTFNQ
jgi:hypothetical protein